MCDIPSGAATRRLRNILFVPILALLGCGPEIQYELYNNSGAAVTIDNCEGDRFIDAGERGTIYDCDPGPALLRNESRWTYASIPGRLAESSFAMLQLEPDGSIIAIRAGDDVPVGSDYPQAPGFPIRPDGQELLR